MQEWVETLNEAGRCGRPMLFILDFSGEQGIVLDPEEAARRGMRWDLSRETGFRDAPEETFSFEAEPVTLNVYRRAFDRVHEEFLQGNTYLLNLTFPSEIRTSLSMKEIFERAQAPFRLLVPGRFVVFSPESFIRIRNNRIATYPMKGTIDASLDDAERRLQENSKEKAEHTAVVDLLRNDLSKVAIGVRVRRYRYLERIQTLRAELIHSSSEIVGEIQPGWQREIGTILKKLLPAGSISGAPKDSSVKIIRRVERAPRGFFTGVFGYFDGNSVESAVMIRFIEKRGERLFFRSGGGLMVDSDPGAEYRELVEKIYVPIP